MDNDELAFIATNDLAAITRGRALPLAELESYLDTGCGWVPANLGIGPFGHIVSDNVFGSVGDLRLIPDPRTRCRIAGIPGRPPVTVLLADTTTTKGTPWDGCPRTFARRALADLEAEFGLRVLSSFEHEFIMTSADGPADAPFSLQAFRRGEPLGTDLMRILHAASLEPEMWLPEYGAHQWEVTLAPADGLTAADRAILLRDIVRDLVDARGDSASFAPLIDPDGSGSGVHVHLSLRDTDGVPATFDASRPGRLSAAAGSFAAGILRHTAALVAITAPSVVSYLRLVPHRWSAGHAFLGERNREALLRVCPTVDMAGKDPARQLNLEYRAADATANPWLVMGALVRAGLQGLREELPAPPVVDVDVDSLTAEERDRAGIRELPRSLAEALDCLAADQVVSGWFPPDMLATYVSVKQEEIAAVADLAPAEQTARYAGVY
jgi:glutamine synthetase